MQIINYVTFQKNDLYSLTFVTFQYIEPLRIDIMKLCVLRDCIYYNRPEDLIMFLFVICRHHSLLKYLQHRKIQHRVYRLMPPRKW